MRKLLIPSLIFATVMALVIAGSAQRSSILTATPQLPAGKVMVQLFEWRWDDVARECEAVLGPSGYAAVQISPPQEHVVLPDRQFPWWQRYQPVSYRLISRSGDRSQFVRMIQRCHQAGVQVYADAVINHMAGVDRGVGSAGSAFTKHNYPGLYTSADFHPCRRSIKTYQDHQEVTNCELVGLADLDTGSAKVQTRLAAYLDELLSLGVDGFRIDAAKHIEASDLAVILARLQYRPRLYLYQEVIDPGNEAVKKAEYYANGDVSEFEYGRAVSEAFAGLEGKTLEQLRGLGDRPELVPSRQAVVFIDNHDKQRGHGGGGNYLTYKAGPLHDLAVAFMLAYPYGRPLVMSSFTFDHPDQGPPTDANGQTLAAIAPDGSSCRSGWVCEHRRPAIAGMVGFRNAVGDARLVHWWNSRDQIAFGRGDRGFVAINRASTPLSQTFQTGLPAGRYCNAIRPINPPLQAGRPVVCSGEAIAVQPDGRATFMVPSMGLVALHHQQRLP